MSAMIVVEDVSFRYGRGPNVLSSRTASFDEGAVHSITGPSGCGKSTLLYVVGLMLRPSAGRLTIAGEELANAPDRVRAHRRGDLIGFVFQDALLDPSLTVMENILEGIPPWRRQRDHRPMIDQQLERLGLAGLEHRRAANLSGGQAQRAGLARSLAKQPKILLADEPTGNLDDVTAAVVLDEIFSFGRQHGSTAIVVTHDQRIAARADVRHVVDAPC